MDVVDHVAGTFLDGSPNGIPVLAGLAEAIAHAGYVPDFLICGVAPADGLLSPGQRVVLLDGIARGFVDFFIDAANRRGEFNGRVVAIGSDEFFAYLEQQRGQKRITVVAHTGDTLESIGKKYQVPGKTMERINRIPAALDRLNDGEYGICVECSEKIAAARLRALPEVQTCVRCQDMLERRGRHQELEPVEVEAGMDDD